MKDIRNRWALEAAALLLPILIVASPFLFSSRSLDGRDFRTTLRGRAAFARESAARDGEWPRWNSRQYAGTPFLGDLQGSLHYPPNLLFLVMAPERAFGFLFVFHIVVAAIGMYRLSRYFEFRRSAAVLGGVAYGVCFSVAAHMEAGALGHFVAPAVAPWILLLILRMVKRASMIRLVLLAAAFGAVLLGGDPHDVPPLLVLCPGLLVWTAVDARRRKRVWKKSSLVPIALAAALGTALACASILPALEVRRYAAEAAPSAGPETDWRILYVGVLPALLALLPFQSFKRGPALFFGISGLLALLPALIRIPVCSLWVAALSLCGLAAMGWDGLARGRYTPRKMLRLLSVLGGAAVVGAGLFLWRFRVYGDPAILLGLFGLSAVLVMKLPAHRLGIVAAVLITAADLCFFAARSVRTVGPEEAAPSPWYAAVIGPEREAYRLYDRTSTDASPTASGFRLINGSAYPRLSSLDPERQPLEDLNVRWQISTEAPRQEGWQERARHDGRILYETSRSRRLAYLLSTEDPPLTIREAANSIDVSGRSYKPGTLVICESWMPGWKAYSQRRQIPLAPSAANLLQVEVPAGDWYVSVRYEPDPYRTGRTISSTAVAALVGLLIAGMKRSKMAIS